MVLRGYFSEKDFQDIYQSMTEKHNEYRSPKCYETTHSFCLRKLRTESLNFFQKVCSGIDFNK